MNIPEKIILNNPLIWILSWNERITQFLNQYLLFLITFTITFYTLKTIGKTIGTKISSTFAFFNPTYSRPPSPLHGKIHLKFPFWSLEPLFQAVRILDILLLGYFLQMFCMKCDLWVNINYPKAIKHQYNSISRSQPGNQIVSN